MVDQQLDLAVALLVRPRPAQVRLPQRRPCDRERVDRVRLPARPSGAPLRHGQLRRHPHQVLADTEQLPLEPAGELAAVLDRPQPLPVERAGPAEQLVASNRNRLLRPAAVRPRRPRPRSPTACERPVRSRSSRSPPLPLGATGERTDLTRGSSHAPIRSRSTVSDGGGDTTLGSQPSGDIRNRVSRRRPSLSSRSDAATRRRLTVSSRVHPERVAPARLSSQARTKPSSFPSGSAIVNLRVP